MYASIHPSMHPTAINMTKNKTKHFPISYSKDITLNFE